MRPICVPCKRFYRCEKNEFMWEEGSPNGHRPEQHGHQTNTEYAEVIEAWEAKADPYKLWTSDKWKCPGCGHEVLIGVPGRPYAEHYMDGYEEHVANYPPQIRVND